MSGLYFESSSPEELMDVLNAFMLLQIAFATSDVWNRYDGGRNVRMRCTSDSPA